MIIFSGQFLSNLPDPTPIHIQEEQEQVENHQLLQDFQKNIPESAQQTSKNFSLENESSSSSNPTNQDSFSSSSCTTTDKYLQTLQKIAKENAETGQFRTSLQPKEMSSTTETTQMIQRVIRTKVVTEILVIREHTTTNSIIC